MAELDRAQLRDPLAAHVQGAAVGAAAARYLQIAVAFMAAGYFADAVGVGLVPRSSMAGAAFKAAGSALHALAMVPVLLLCVKLHRVYYA
eukprot:tig00001000_g6165.t1